MVNSKSPALELIVTMVIRDVTMIIRAVTMVIRAVAMVIADVTMVISDTVGVGKGAGKGAGNTIKTVLTISMLSARCGTCG